MSTTLPRSVLSACKVFALIRFSSASSTTANGITCHWDLAVSVSLHHISGIHCSPTFAKSSQFLLLGVIWKPTSFSQPFLLPSDTRHTRQCALILLRFLRHINILFTYLHRIRKKGATLFSTITLAFLGRFSPMKTRMNTPQFHVICLLDDVTTVTYHKPRQFNFSLHVKFNHIEFEDIFLIKKKHKNAKRIFVRRLIKKFSNK